MAGELTTLAEIRAYTGLTTGQIADDALTRIWEAAEAFLARKCNRPSGFITDTWTEYVEGYNRDELYVTYPPITGITSIKVIFTGTDSYTISSSLYTYETGLSGRIVAYGNGVNSHVGVFETGRPLVFTRPKPRLFPYGNGRKNIEVIYDGGYANTASVPEDLSQAVIELVGWRARGRKRDPVVTSISLGQFSESYGTPGQDIDPDLGMPFHIAEMVRPYVRPSIP